LTFMKNRLSIIFFCLPFFFHACMGADQSCFSLQSPHPGSIITSPLCTLAVYACDKIDTMQVVAHIPSIRDDQDSAITIGTTARPFSFVWNLSSVENQLYKGATIQLSATFKNGEKASLIKQGIFLFHKTPNLLTADLPFGNDPKSRLFSKTLLPDSNVSADIFTSWDDDGLHVTVKSHCPQITQAIDKDLLPKLGAEVCIDQGSNRRPYPSDSTQIMFFPLSGKAVSTRFKPVALPNGLFDISLLQNPLSIKYTVSIENYKGFTETIFIPFDVIGVGVPQSLRCNIVIKVPVNDGQLQRISWASASGLNSYSPLVWNTLRFLPKDTTVSPFICGIIAFGIALILTIIAGLIFGFGIIQKNKTANTIAKKSEDEEQLFNSIYKFTEENITKKNLATHLIAEKTGFSAKQIEKIIKRYTGRSVKDQVAYLRIEIARERLRSSHASTKSIAESCGFKSVTELEKYFNRFYRITTYAFRKENQVA